MRDWTPSTPMRRWFATFLNATTYRLIAFSVISVFVSLGNPAQAQTQTPSQTPFLFTTTPVSSTQLGMVTLLRDPKSGTLTLLPATAIAFSDTNCFPNVMDVQGSFLYGGCGNGVAMYSFDGTSGAIAEIPTSPYAASTIDAPLLVATEGTGQFLYLLKYSNPTPASAITYVLDTFRIDRTTPALIPVSSRALPFEGTMTETATAAGDPNRHGLAIFLMQTDPTTADTEPMAFIINFDPITGVATIPTEGTLVPGTTPTSFSLSPQGEYLALGSTTTGFNVTPISYTTLLTISQGVFQIVGSATTLINPPNGMQSTEPLFLQFDPLGRLLYVQYANSGVPSGAPSPFEIFQTPELTHIGTLPFEQGNILASAISDPDGSFIYEAASGSPPQGIAVYVIDPEIGLPSQPAALLNPFYPSLALYPSFANYASAGSGQNLTGPFLSQSTPALSFAQTTAGQSSSSQTVLLKNVGGENVSLTSIIPSGPNVSDFALSGDCLVSVLLAPQIAYALSVTYSPAIPGSSLALITVTGNSPTSPQTISLSGTAVAAPLPAPVATLNLANPFSLPGATTQGTSSAPRSITVSNTENAPLHITNVVLGGLNANDYSLGASNCSGAIAANASCSASITFSPQAAGIRSASLAVTDDAANSPQVLNINGTAAAAVSIAAATGGSTAASVSAGQTAQFTLTVTPAVGFSGTITFTCSGAPFGATCTVPASITVANGIATPFTVTVTTSGAAVSAATASTAARTSSPNWPDSSLLPHSPILALASIAALALLVASKLNSSAQRPVRSAIFMLILVALVFSGMSCSGGPSSQSAQPSQPSTPQIQAAATPLITPNGGTFSTSYPSVTITDSTPGTAIFFTVDGSTPTSASSAYSAPFPLNASATVKAVATAANYSASSVASASFQLQTATGAYTIVVTPTAVATGSTKQLQLNPIQLTLIVK
jgi:Fn3 associated